jgi:hypothetical protein
MSAKNSKTPDSDQTARRADTDLETDASESPDSRGIQTSNKSGKHSSVLKEAASRPGRGTGTQAKQVSGAFGNPGLVNTNQGVPRAKTKSRRGSQP